MKATYIENDPSRSQVSPDQKRASALGFYSGSAGTIPAQWSNSSLLSGSRLTSAFGANPKSKKKTVLSYQEFLKTKEKVANNK
jgi:hypothetical protein